MIMVPMYPDITQSINLALFCFDEYMLALIIVFKVNFCILPNNLGKFSKTPSIKPEESFPFVIEKDRVKAETTRESKNNSNAKS